MNRPTVERVLLSLYPRAWRETRGQDAVATLASVCGTRGIGRCWREIADVARYAVRLRFGLASWQPAGQVLQLASPFVVACAAGLSIVGVLADAVLGAAYLGGPWRLFGPFFTDGVLAFVPWLVAFLAGMAGLVRMVRLCAWLALAGSAVGVVLAQVDGYVRAPLFILLPITLMAVVVALAPVDGQRERRGVVAGAVLVAGFLLAQVLFLPPWPAALRWYGGGSVWSGSAAWVPVILVGLAVGGVAASRSDSHWPGAIAVLSAPLALFAAGADRQPAGHSDSVILGVAVVAAAVLVGTAQYGTRWTVKLERR